MLTTVEREERHVALAVPVDVPELAATPVPALVQAVAATAALVRRETRRRACVALIDEFSLRRASTLNLLRMHVREGALPFCSTAELLTQLDAIADDLSCVIVNVGGRSVAEAPVPEQLRRLQHALAAAPVIVLSDREEVAEVVAAFRHGARGYIPTSLEPRLAMEALKLVWAGGTYFPVASLARACRRPVPAIEERTGDMSEQGGEPWPPRQLAVLRLLVQGKANKEIARALQMEESTVKVHVRHIMRKLGATNRTQAALRARRAGVALEAEPGAAGVSAD